MGQLRDLIRGQLGRNSVNWPTGIIFAMKGGVKNIFQSLTALWNYTSTHKNEIPCGTKSGLDGVPSILFELKKFQNSSALDKKNAELVAENSLREFLNIIFIDIHQFVDLGHALFEPDTQQRAEFDSLIK